MPLDEKGPELSPSNSFNYMVMETKLAWEATGKVI